MKSFADLALAGVFRLIDILAKEVDASLALLGCGDLQRHDDNYLLTVFGSSMVQAEPAAFHLSIP